MKIIWVVSIILSFILILSYFPIITSQTIRIRHDSIISENFFQNDQEDDSKMLNVKIYNYNKNNNIDKNTKKLTIDDYKKLTDCLKEVAISNFSVREIFEKKLDILKDYGLVKDSTDLEDIIDIDILEVNTNQIDIVTNESFVAHFAPILVVGGGFGVGLGLPDLRLYNGFTHFFGLVGGLGTVICFDPFEAKLYTLVAFLLPILIGYLSGYMGIIMFAINPGTFYANLVMLGIAPLTIWIQFPTIE